MSRSVRLLATLLCATLPSFCSSIRYSSYFGGTGPDSINSMARNSGTGALYVVGSTGSRDFPVTAGVYQATSAKPSGSALTDAFVAKFDASGQLVWATLLGGSSGDDAAYDVKIDAGGYVYVAGLSGSADFPATYVPSSSSKKVFVAKLTPDGAGLVYSVRLSDSSSPPRLALDGSGNAYVTAGGACCTAQTGIIGSLGGVGDLWVARIPGNSVPWSLRIGTAGNDSAGGVAVDSSGRVYLAGSTDSNAFPCVGGAYCHFGEGSGFVMKLDPAKTGSAAIICSAVTGPPSLTSGDDFIQNTDIAVDGSGQAFVSAWSYARTMPTAQYAFQKAKSTGSNPDLYIFRLSASGASLTGTYLGGTQNDFGGRIALDGSGHIYVGGSTDSSDLPVTSAGAPPAQNAMVVKLNRYFAADGAVQLGGNSWDYGQSVLADGSGGVWAAGGTYSTDFPVTGTAVQHSILGETDGFLTRLSFAPCALNSTDRTVTICTPASNAAVTGPVRVVAGANDTSPVQVMWIYVDGVKAYATHAAALDQSLTLAAGTHRLTVQAQDAAGAIYKSTRYITVSDSGGCQLDPAKPSVTICSPLNGQTVPSPVTVHAFANDDVPVTMMQLYVDGTMRCTLKNTAELTCSVSLGAGTHRFTVRLYDSYGRTAQKTVYAAVQ